jgi:hypothetical protein
MTAVTAGVTSSLAPPELQHRLTSRACMLAGLRECGRTTRRNPGDERSSALQPRGSPNRGCCAWPALVDLRRCLPMLADLRTPDRTGARDRDPSHHSPDRAQLAR